MEIIENKALLLITKKADQIKALIPCSEILERHGDKAKVLVRWGEDEFRLLRNMQIKAVPHPILGRYNWPGIYTPFEHQRTTAAFLATHPRCFVLSCPGTGKTNAAAWAADYLLKQGRVRRVLVVCPVSIMDTAWRADLFRTLMHRTVGIASGDRTRRLKIIQGDYEFVIINYDGVKVVQDALAEAEFDLIICDEASNLKNTSTDRWKAVAALVQPTTRLWLMTGTPAAQSPMDAYGLAKLVNPGAVPRFAGAFRDKVMKQVTRYRWMPREGAQEIVHSVLQPAIRYTKEECLDLPDMLYATRDVPLTKQQTKFYEWIRKEMVATAAGEEITATNAAGLLNKLLQISCIAYNTPVLTNRGWVPIQAVRSSDQVWDGEEFVRHGGLVENGTRAVVQCHGVWMTPEHQVLTRSGWRPAQEILDGNAREGFDRQPVRLPDRDSTAWDDAQQSQESDVALPLHLREGSCAGESVPAHGLEAGAATLRMPAWEQAARHVYHETVSYLDEYVATMRIAYVQRLEKLRRAGDSCVRPLERILCKFLGRYGANISSELDARPYRQQRSVQPGELPLGYAATAGEQHAEQLHTGNSGRANDRGGSCTALQNPVRDVARSTGSVQLAAEQSTHYSRQADVYDIANCGPRNRFVVRGQDGQPLIVHNCGAAYTVDREVIEFDISHRMQELLDVVAQTRHKVIVFVPYRHVLIKVQEELAKAGITTAAIHGGTPAGQRAEYIKQFQSEDDPKVILLIPQAAAHGVTLTRADTVVWWGPVTSAELYLQGNARAHRAGQRNPVTVVRLQGSSVERRMYGMLDNKVDLHQGLIDLFRQEIA